jgi:hypothetical protein
MKGFDESINLALSHCVQAGQDEDRSGACGGEATTMLRFAFCAGAVSFIRMARLALPSTALRCEDRSCRSPDMPGTRPLWATASMNCIVSNKVVELYVCFKVALHRPNHADKMIGHNTALKRAAASPVETSGAAPFVGKARLCTSQQAKSKFFYFF